MLVLARRSDESIVFPNVGIKLKVIRIKGQVARLGIEAPEDVAILRGEIASEKNESQRTSSFEKSAECRQPTNEWVHEFRNRMNYILLSVELLQDLIEHNRTDEFSEKFSGLIDELQSLDEMIEPADSTPDMAAMNSELRILLIDDQENERTLLADLLEMKGCQVDTVGDGFEAMEYLETHPHPDFILLDMSMPRCNGPEFLELLRHREDLRDLRVFAVSGHSSQSAGVPVGPDGVDGWFRKPLNTSRLISSMNKVAHA